MSKKGIAVVNPATLQEVHKLMEDGTANFGKTDGTSTITFKGTMMIDHDGSSQSLSSVLTSLSASAGGDVTAERNRAIAAEQEISGNLATEISQRVADSGSFDSRLDVIEGSGAGSINKAVSDLTGDAAEAYNTLGKLEDKIQAEESRATTAEGLLSGRLDVIEGTGEGSISKAVADLVDAAPGALDTLNELAQAIDDDANFAATVATTIGNEETRATTAENALSGRLDALEGSGNGSVAKAISDLIGDAAEGYDTLGELEDKIQTEEGRVDTLMGDASTVGSLNKAVADLKGDAAEAYNTLGKLEDMIQTEEGRVDTLMGDASTVGSLNKAVADLKGDAAADYDTLGKLEDKIQTEQGRIDSFMSNSDADMTITGLATFNDVRANGSIRIPVKTSVPAAYARLTDGTEGTDEAGNTAYQARMQAHNGEMFYLNAADDAARTDFEDGKKWYFCENGIWYASPFFSE